MTDRETKLAHRNILTSLLVTTSEHPIQLDSISDLFIFLLRYSFLLNNASKTQNSRGLKTPQLNVPQGNIYMGARYLDPKYSRWISEDPALSSYRDPSKVPDFDETGKPNRFKFHVAPTVNINGKKYVVDPFYHKSWYSISEQDDWYSCRYFEN